MEKMKKLGHAPHTVGLTMEENHWDFHFNPQNLLCDWFFKEKSNHLHLQSLGSFWWPSTRRALPGRPCPARHTSATRVTPSQALGAAFGTSLTHHQSCKNEQLELCFIWKSEFSAPPTFFSQEGNTVKMFCLCKALKGKKNANQTKNMKSAEPERSSNYTHFFKAFAKVFELN